MAWEKHLRAHRVAFVKGPLVHSPTHPEGDGSWSENRAMYFCDPDGNAIEIFCDMAPIDFEKDEIDPAWFADRLERDGYRPDEADPPPLTK